MQRLVRKRLTGYDKFSFDLIQYHCHHYYPQRDSITYHEALSPLSSHFIPGIGEFDPSDEAALYYTIANPSWFSEGVASLCGTLFAEYDRYISSALHEDEEKPYTASGLYEFSQSSDLTMDFTDYINYSWNELYKGRDPDHGTGGVLYLEGGYHCHGLYPGIWQGERKCPYDCSHRDTRKKCPSRMLML